MYTLYIANKNYSSWSLRPWLLLKVLEIPFAEQLVQFAGAANRTNFSSFSPTSQVPCLHHGDLVVWDSLAICEYLAERHPGVWPTDTAARAWARCIAAEMHSGFGTLREVCGMSVGIRVELKDYSAALERDWQRLTAIWEQGLQNFGGPFVAGAAFSAADAFFAPVAFRWQTYQLPLQGKALGYCQRLLDLPAMQQWQQQALAETWRDPAHEDDFLRYGTLSADYRASA